MRLHDLVESMDKNSVITKDKGYGETSTFTEIRSYLRKPTNRVITIWLKKEEKFVGSCGLTAPLGNASYKDMKKIVHFATKLKDWDKAWAKKIQDKFI